MTKQLINTRAACDATISKKHFEVTHIIILLFILIVFAGKQGIDVVE